MTAIILRLLDNGYNVYFSNESIEIVKPGNEIRQRVGLKRFFSLKDVKDFPIVVESLLLNMEKELDNFYKLSSGVTRPL